MADLQPITHLTRHQVRELPHLWDFKGWMAPHLHRISGYATTQQSDGMHEMFFKRDAQDRVRVVFRQSSQSSGWFPEGPGELVFRTLPTGEPPAADMLSDDAWSCADVKGNVRRWLKQIVGGADLLSAEREWESVFDDMPHNGDVNLLPAHHRLQWPDLPQGIVSAPQGGPSGAMGSVDMVEGPEVNPIQGMHRSYDDVRRDLHRHQRNERKAALAAGSLAPIYVSEYIFFSTGSAGRIEVALGRVCTVPPIKNASKGVMIDVSAYTHTPPPPAKAGGTAVLGFFGS